MILRMLERGRFVGTWNDDTLFRVGVLAPVNWKGGSNSSEQLVLADRDRVCYLDGGLGKGLLRISPNGEWK
jgi:hypothetical protein